MSGVKPDWWIREMTKRHGMIEPFSEREADSGISYGLQPCGYDARLDPEVQVFDWARAAGVPLDPLKVDPRLYVTQNAEPYYDIPPHGFIQGLTVEHFRIPQTCCVRGVGKTVYSSVGIAVNISGIHPGWEGRLRIHIANQSPVPIRIYGNHGIIYLEFTEIDGACEKTYDQLPNTRFQNQHHTLHS